MQAHLKYYTFILLVGGAIALASCDSDPFQAEDREQTIEIDLSDAFRKTVGEATFHCISVIDSVFVAISVDGRPVFEQAAVVRQHAASVSFPVANIPVGRANVSVDVLSVNGTTVYRGATSFDATGPSFGTINVAVAPSAPIMRICPATLTFNQGGEFIVENIGTGTLRWSAVEPPDLCDFEPCTPFFPTSGSAVPADIDTVFVVRNNFGGAAEFEAGFTSLQGDVPVQIIVTPNLAPKVEFPNSEERRFIGDEFVIALADVATDSDGDRLEFDASSSNTEVATVSVDGDSLRVRSLRVGDCRISLRVSDGTQDAIGEMQYIVPNRAPVVLQSVGPQEVVANDAAAYDLLEIFRDPDDHPLEYEAVSNNNDLLLAGIDGSTMFVFSRGPLGPANVQAFASDPFGETASISFGVDVLRRFSELSIVSAAVGAVTRGPKDEFVLPVSIEIQNEGTDTTPRFRLTAGWRLFLIFPPPPLVAATLLMDARDNFGTVPGLSREESRVYTGTLVLPSDAPTVVPLAVVFTVDSCFGEQFVPPFCRVNEDNEANNEFGLRISLPQG